jgi:ADP-ribosylglycohydrolase
VTRGEGGAIGDALSWPVELGTLEQMVNQCGPGGVREFLPASYGQVTGRGLVTDDT